MALNIWFRVTCANMKCMVGFEAIGKKPSRSIGCVEKEDYESANDK